MKSKVNASSLVEVLVAMTILLVVFGITVTTIANVHQSEQEVLRFIDVEENPEADIVSINETPVNGLSSCKSVETVYQVENERRYSTFEIVCYED